MQPVPNVLSRGGRAGALVTRDEIQRTLWPDDTYVDFGLGINSCIRQIRIALDDDAEAPRYVQTVSKRGYRFIASIAPEAWTCACEDEIEFYADLTRPLRKQANKPFVTVFMRCHAWC